MTEKGSNTIRSMLNGQGSGCEGGLQGLFCRSEETAVAKGHPSFQEWLYWQDWWLPEEAWGSVSDKAEQVEDPKAAEVVARDLVWKL